MSATSPHMPAPRPALAAYADALRAGDRVLAELIARRLFPRARCGGPHPSPAARRTVDRVLRSLGL